MKFVIVTIARGAKGVYQYPAPYDAHEVERERRGNPLVYEGRIPQGDLSEEMLMRLEDPVADRYVAESQGGMRLATNAEVDAWLVANASVQARPDERIEYPDRIQIIQARAAAGLPVRPRDLAALDPDDPEPGVGRTPKTRQAIFRR